jgi:hypothetical protein
VLKNKFEFSTGQRACSTIAGEGEEITYTLTYKRIPMISKFSETSDISFEDIPIIHS